MIKQLALIVIAIICFSAVTSYSVESVRVAVLPFEIEAGEELLYLTSEIPKVISSHLKQDGAIILEPDVKSEAIDYSPEDDSAVIDEIRKAGIKYGADFVVWGSFTGSDQKFSISVKMMDLYGETPLSSFSVGGEGIENLPLTVEKLAGDISLKLFKKEKVVQVLVKGNDRIETDAIKRVIATKPGDIYLTKSLTKDLRTIYAMGYFEDIRIESEESADGKIIIFNLKEKPTVKKITITGNLVFKDEKVKENLSLKIGSILNNFQIRSDIARVEVLYKEKHYYNAAITYKIHPLKHNQAELELIVDEGEKVLIRKITFQGNDIYKAKQLKKIIKTKKKGFFSFLTGSGRIDENQLNQDVAMLQSFYHNNGYIQARVGEPLVTFEEDDIYIIFKINEGLRFKVGKVDIDGDLILSKERLIAVLKITKETYYNRSVIRDDILALTDIYNDAGYAYAEILPQTIKNMDELIVNITFIVNKGQLVYFERINITGNNKTRDKVIRRELPVVERGLYMGNRLKRGIRNLKRLEYFEEVKVNTEKGSDDDLMILDINVSEKATGSFTFGGGYSTVENVFATGSITQRNFLGKGQIVSLQSQFGSRTTAFILNFTEPWLFDIPLSAGIDLFSWKKSYDTYDTDSKGGGLTMSYPIFDFTRASFGYSLSFVDIQDLDHDASDSLWDLQGENTTSSVTIGIKYDSRDSTFNPQEGSEHGAKIQYAGLGGNIGFTKVSLETGWYIPGFWKVIYFLHGKSGFVWRNTGGDLPDYERFYLGGINSLRGFDWEDLSPKTTNSWGYESEIGGTKFVQFNFELRFPLFGNAGIIGLLFFDTGDLYDTGEPIRLGSLRKSAGFGFRWNSPMGPIRIEYGKVIHSKEGESSGGFEFSMGSAF
ncbi:MAG: outer membrane protein assembly factor BamA [Desulfosarcina sp.]|nr:outer membrane protein assembly factor BamA [Desulfobacterales bacterium]